MTLSSATLLCCALLSAVLPTPVEAQAASGPDARFAGLRERIEQRRSERAKDADAALPAGARVLRDLAYGASADQRFDVHLPADARNAPVILMVHGGGWRRGDKSHGRVLDNKIAHWLPTGVILVSTNYRMLPEAEVPVQRDDVAAALAKVRELAPSWGGDPSRIVLMGHSAGAHLVALVASAAPPGVLGTVLLDSGALDVERLMKERHAKLFDQAFGSDPAFWRATSPLHRLSGAGQPWLAVCSSRRRQACDQVDAFARRVRELGGRIDVLPLDMSHGDINAQLGHPGAYTERVDAFLRDIGALK